MVPGMPLEYPVTYEMAINFGWNLASILRFGFFARFQSL